MPTPTEDPSFLKCHQLSCRPAAVSTPKPLHSRSGSGQSPHQPYPCSWGSQCTVWGHKHPPSCLSFSLEPPSCPCIAAPVLSGPLRSAELHLKPLLCFAFLSAPAFPSHPTGDNAEQGSPWGLATHSLPLCLVKDFPAGLCFCGASKVMLSASLCPKAFLRLEGTKKLTQTIEKAGSHNDGGGDVIRGCWVQDTLGQCGTGRAGCWDKAALRAGGGGRPVEPQGGCRG